jgi:hypothetical protein
MVGNPPSLATPASGGIDHSKGKGGWENEKMACPLNGRTGGGGGRQIG